MDTQFFLEDIRMAAKSHPNFDKKNTEHIADIYGHSKEYIQKLVKYERAAINTLKAANDAIAKRKKSI